MAEEEFKPPMIRFEMRISTSDGVEDRFGNLKWNPGVEYILHSQLDPIFDSSNSLPALMTKAFDAALKEFLRDPHS